MKRIHHVEFRRRSATGLLASEHPLLDTLLRGWLLVGLALLPSLPALIGSGGDLLRWSFWLLLASGASLLLMHRQNLFNRAAALRRTLLVRPSQRRPHSVVQALPARLKAVEPALRRAA
ncbi:MAG: hypothetical protein KDI78_00965 [Xanthomonadales bacterium]|nr:hypothetical protein [Xanthomonadales bacterium]